jgi:HPt (histidine-containing phosphotransfer) domain-containing protein
MIDISLLNTLFDDEILVRKYLTVFKNDAPQIIAGLKENIKNLDWENASITAHSLKSQLQYLKESEASDLAYQIEKICDNTTLIDHDLLIKYINQLTIRVDIILANIKDFLLSA